MAEQRRPRLQLLDALRGFALVNMIAYHGLWDLVYLFGVKLDWYVGLPGYLWQQSICWLFILLSGFCLPLGRNPLRRGLTVFAGGALVMGATAVFMPQSRVLFGVLTCLGSAMLLMAPLGKLLKKADPRWAAAGCFGLFLLTRNVPAGSLGFEKLAFCPLPEALYRNNLTAYLSFPQPGFFSTDYFPLIPWFFLYATGYFLHGVLARGGLAEKLFARGRLPVLNWAGRHSLILYLLHQPALYGLCLLGGYFLK